MADIERISIRVYPNADAAHRRASHDKVSKVTKEVLTMNKFVLKVPYQPTGDQPQAIAELVKGFK